MCFVPVIYIPTDPDLIAFSDECGDTEDTVNLNMMDNILVEQSQLSDYAY